MADNSKTPNKWSAADLPSGAAPSPPVSLVVEPHVPALPSSFETARLHLRLPRESDAVEIFSSYAQDPDVTRFLVWKPHAHVGETRGFISECIASLEAGSRFPYVLCSIAKPHTAIGMLEARIAGHEVSLGYVLARSYWGNGYMPEAVRALADLVLSEPRFFRVSAFCDVDNQASQRTLEKAGFAREGRHERFSMHPNVSSEPRPCFMYARWRG